MKVKTLIITGTAIAGLATALSIEQYKKHLIDPEMIKISYNEKNIFSENKQEAFYLSRTEITQYVYEKVMKKNPSVIKGLNHPVENVSWYDAIEFCNKMSRLYFLKPCYLISKDSDGNKIVACDFSANGFRLPTVSEWETGAKGSERDIKNRYCNKEKLTDIAWDDPYSTHAVAQKYPNSFGLYDMSGNVSEWCWDIPVEYKSKSYNDYHIYKGGGMDYDYSNYDINNSPSKTACAKSVSTGFRICSSSSIFKKIISQAEIADEQNTKSIMEKAELQLYLPMTEVVINSNENKITGFGNFHIGTTEISNKLYKKIMKNSWEGVQSRMTNVSWYDTIEFCNLLSEKRGRKPCYSINGNTKPDSWDSDNIECDFSANGYRLPTEAEWDYAIRNKEIYTPKEDIAEWCWNFKDNSKKIVKRAYLKKYNQDNSNENVYEKVKKEYLSSKENLPAAYSSGTIGFRICCTDSINEYPELFMFR